MSKVGKSQKYSIRDIIVFGEKLITTEDLDPVYCALYRANLPQSQLYRLLLAYFLFYHLGAAAQLSEWEGDDYWGLMENAAANEIPPNMNGDWPGDNWPRGTERRHFRGKVCVKAMAEIEKFCSTKEGPESFVGVLLGMSQMVDFKGFLASVQVFPLFGPWIAFKVADTLERVCSAPIEFPNDLTLLYKEPRAALDLLDVPAEQANAKLLKRFGKILAPPYVGRRCNIQEVETICCKWKSSLGGHYWIGKDIHEIRKGLKGWGKTAEKLFKAMPPEVGQGLFK